MGKAIASCIVVALLLSVYQLPAVRGRVNVQYTEDRIESQCDAIAECRAVDNRLECWFITITDDIHHSIMADDVTDRPSNLSFEAVCQDINKQSI